MKNLKETKDKVEKFNNVYGNLRKEITQTLTQLVTELGGNVEIKDNYADSTSCIIIYVEDDNYVQVERVYISKAGNLYVETNVDSGLAEDMGVGDLLFILEWIVDQVENPDNFVDEDDDNEDD